MQTSQPQENPNIPENLKNHIESVKNTITLGESEVSRLNALTISHRYTIDQLVIQEKALKESVDILTSKANKLQEEVVIENKKLETVTSNSKKIDEAVKGREQESLIKANELARKEAELEVEREMLVKQQSDFNKEREAFNQEKVEHEARVEKLKNALS